MTATAPAPSDIMLRHLIAIAREHGFRAWASFTGSHGTHVVVAIPYTSANGDGYFYERVRNLSELRNALGY